MASQMKSCRPKTPGGNAAMPEYPPPSLPPPSFLHSPLVSLALNTVNVDNVMMGTLVLVSSISTQIKASLDRSKHLWTDQSFSRQIKASLDRSKHRASEHGIFFIFIHLSIVVGSSLARTRC